MSFFQSSEISIIVEDPLFLSTRTFFDRLTNQVNSYNHEVRRIGGYWSATLRINDRQGRIEDWVENGLGRHIQVSSPSLTTIWEGFVNNISANLGGTLYQVGPLMRIGNSVNVAYSTVNVASTAPLTLGKRVVTSSASNTASQALHGLIQKRKGINAATQTQAEQIRDLFVNDPQRAFPQKSRDSSLGGGGGPSVTLECLGYWHWLSAFYYSRLLAGQINVSAIITEIVNSDPNSILSSDIGGNFNTFQVNAYNAGNETAEVVMKRYISFGDVSNNPYSGGFYADQKLAYEPVPTNIEYQLRIQDNVGIANTLGGREKPWNIQPGRWIFDPYLLIGRKIPTSSEELGLDPRTVLLESVKFDAPWGLSLNGVKLSQLDQVMARRGLGGIA